MEHIRTDASLREALGVAAPVEAEEEEEVVVDEGDEEVSTDSDEFDD